MAASSDLDSMDTIELLAHLAERIQELEQMIPKPPLLLFVGDEIPFCKAFAVKAWLEKKFKDHDCCLKPIQYDKQQGNPCFYLLDSTSLCDKLDASDPQSVWIWLEAPTKSFLTNMFRQKQSAVTFYEKSTKRDEARHIIFQSAEADELLRTLAETLEPSATPSSR